MTTRLSSFSEMAADDLEGVREGVRVRGRECVRVCEREGVRVRGRVCVRVRQREGVRVRGRVNMCERDGESECERGEGEQEREREKWRVMTWFRV